MNKMKAFINQKKQAFHALGQQNKFLQPGLLVVVALLAVVGIYLIFRSFAATVQTLTFTPTADATVANKGAANTNYGTNPTLIAVAGTSTTARKDFLLKFTVSGISGKKIDSIKLKLYATNGSGSGGKIYAANNTVISSDNSTSTLPDWTDGSVNWNNAYKIVNPPVLASVGSVSAGHWYSFDVTAAVKVDGTYTFRVASSSTNNVAYGSKESAYAPQIVATVEPPADTIAPTAPSGLKGFTVDSTRADLSWTPSSDDQGVVGYYVYANGVKVDETHFTQLIPAIMAENLRPSTLNSIYVKAVDAAGNLSPSSNTITLTTNPPGPTIVTCPTTAEGVKISINSASSFSCASINNILKANAYPGDFAKIAPLLTINVQDTIPTQVAPSLSSENGVFTAFTAILYFKGVNSTASIVPDRQLSHEYGHVWNFYHDYIDHNGDLRLNRENSIYDKTRWDIEDGALTISQNPLLNHSYEWQDQEIIAEDYRLQFGSLLGIAEGTQINPDIPDPRSQPGLRDWFLNTWAVKQP